MNRNGKESATSGGDRWVWGLGGFFLIVLSANSLLVYHALKKDRPLVRDDYYAASLKYDDTRENRIRADATAFSWHLEPSQAGWELRLQYAFPPDIKASGKESLEGPVRFHGTLRFYRPSDPALDREVQVQYMGWDENQGYALYHAAMEPLQRGAWEILVNLTDGQGVHREKVFRRFVEGG